MMKLQFETRKLPKGHSFVLKPKVLQAALDEAAIDIDTHVIRSHGRCFKASFWPPNPRVPYERLYIQVGSVPSEQAFEARRKFENIAIPKLVRWIADILMQDAKTSLLRRGQQALDLSLD